LNNISNWSSGLPNVVYDSNGAYLRAIVFDEEFDTDGGSDGELTLQEAITALCSYYVTNSGFPPGGVIAVSSANIILKRSNSNN
jgi:hypothetical protein